MTDATQVWPVGTRKQLLFDRRFVESSADLLFTVNPPVERTPVNLPPLSGFHLPTAVGALGNVNGEHGFRRVLPIFLKVII